MSAKATNRTAATRTAALSLTSDTKTRLAWAVLAVWAVALVGSIATTLLQGGDVAAAVSQPIWALGVITFSGLFIAAGADEDR